MFSYRNSVIERVIKIGQFFEISSRVRRSV